MQLCTISTWAVAVPVRDGTLTEGQVIIAVLVILSATTLYGLGFVVDTTTPTPVEPQSVFTIYGTVLGYLFGASKHRSEPDSKEKDKSA